MKNYLFLVYVYIIMLNFQRSNLNIFVSMKKFVIAQEKVYPHLYTEISLSMSKVQLYKKNSRAPDNLYIIEWIKQIIYFLWLVSFGREKNGSSLSSFYE